MKQPPIEPHPQSVNPVSAEMTAALDLMIRRVRRLIVLRGLSLVILTWLTGLAIAMAIDGYWVIYSAWARWGLALATYAPAAAVAAWSLLRPLSQTLTPTGLARAIERRHPELHERISSAVQLIDAQDAPDQQGSAALIHALGNAAAADIRRVDPRVEISIRKVARYLAVCAAALLVVVAACLAWPSTAGRLALRSALPILNLPNIHAGHLTVEPGDTVMLHGDRLRVLLTSTRSSLPDARLIMEHADERRQTHTMNRMTGSGDRGDSRFSLVTEPVNADFSYRIRGGDAVTRAYQVTVTPRPTVNHLDLTYQYPDYTGQEISRTRVVQGDIRAITGADVTVRVAFNKPLEHIVLFIDGNPVAQTGAAPTAQPATGGPAEKIDGAEPVAPFNVSLRQPEPDAAVFRVRLEPGMQSTWRIEGADRYGFRGGTRDALLHAVADAVPEVKITQPADNQLNLRATDRITLHYTISDDFGIGLAGLILEADGRPLPIRTLPLPDQGATRNRTLSGQLTVDLSDLALQQTRRLAMQLRARDLRSSSFGGPQVGKSRILMIELAAGARPYREQVLDQHTDRLRQALTAARSEVSKTERTLAGLDRTLKQPASDAKTVHETTRRTLDAMEAIDHALETAGEIMRDGFYDGLRQPLTTEAGAAVIDAAETVSQIPIADDREAQIAMAEAAAAGLDRADSALESMLTELDGMHEALEHAIATRELAERQADLATAMDREKQPAPEADATAATDIANALTPEIEPATPAAPADPASLPETDPTDELLARLRTQQEALIDDLAAMINTIPDAGRIAVEQTREQVAHISAEADDLQKRHQGLRERAEEAERMAADWETAADELSSQFAALAEAHREQVLPRPSVPLGEIAADLEAGRLRQAAEKIDSLTDDLAQRRETLEREERTEALAEKVRELAADHAPILRQLEKQPPATHATEDANGDHDILETLADQFDQLAKDAQQATPLAQQAFERHNPADDLRSAVQTTDETDPQPASMIDPDALETARDKADRLRAAMDTAARIAKAERLAERIDAVAEELATMEALLARSEDLARRMADAIDPWEQALDSATAHADAQVDTARRQQDAIAAEAEALTAAMDENPTASAALTDRLQQALTPPERAPDASPATDARQAAQAAEETRQAAETIDDAIAQTQDRADASVQRARDALDDLADVTNNDLVREARWRLEEAEEIRERDRQRADDAGAVAEKLKQMAQALDQIAESQLDAAEQLAEIAGDRDRIAEAQALAQQAQARAESAERAVDRLRETRERLADQQQALLAESGETPATDARTLAQWDKEQIMPAAADAMLDLADAAAELAQRQSELADAIAAAKAGRDELRQQAADMQQAATHESPPGTLPPSTDTADRERQLMEQYQDLENELMQLSESQKQLAQESRDLKQQAAELTADSRPMALPQPEQMMDRTAHALEAADADMAQTLAQQAADQQSQLAEALADRISEMQPDARMAAASQPPAATPPPSAAPVSPPSPTDPSQASPASPGDPQPAPPPASSDPSSPSQPTPPSPSEPTAHMATESTPAMPEPMPPMDIPPSQQAAFDWEDNQRELIGEQLIPETEVIPNIGIDQDQVQWDLGHAHERPEQNLPEDFDLGTPKPSDTPLHTDFAGAPDVPVPPVPQAPKKEAMSGPVPFSDPVSMTEPVTELPKIIMPDRFPQTFEGEFSDAPIPPPPPEKSSSLAPAPRLTESDLDAAKKEFAELSAIHIDDSPHSSDMGGQAIEELPAEMLFEPGAQYSKGAPGQSSMPGMELGQLAQAENQDQQSDSPAQTPMPSAGGSGGGEDDDSPSQSASSESQSPPPSGSQASSSGGSSSGTSSGEASTSPPESPTSSSEQPPQQAASPTAPAAPGATLMPPGGEQGTAPVDPALPPAQTAEDSGMQRTPPVAGQPAPFDGMPGSEPESPLAALQATAEAERIRQIEERLDPGLRTATSLPDHSDWRDAIHGDAIPAETVGRLFDQLQQLGGLTPRLLPHVQIPALPDQAPTTAGSGEMLDIDALLPLMATHAQALNNVFPAVDPEATDSDVPLEHRALAEALQYAGRAALAGDPRDAEEAARRMALTAQEARRRAEAMGLSIEPRMTGRADDGDLTDDQLRRLGLPVSDWLRLPGELRSEVMQARPAEGPEEYRALIRRYFSDIARESQTE